MFPVQSVRDVTVPYRVPSAPPTPICHISIFENKGVMDRVYISSYLKKELIEGAWAVSGLPFSAEKAGLRAEILEPNPVRMELLCGKREKLSAKERKIILACVAAPPLTARDPRAAWVPGRALVTKPSSSRVS